MARLRAHPPVALAGEPVEVTDLTAAAAPTLPPTDAVLITGETLKVVVRPSGTEPKLKCYLEVRVPQDRSKGWPKTAGWPGPSSVGSGTEMSRPGLGRG